MSSLFTQLPWILAYFVVLLLQTRFIQRKNWFGSILLIWISLVLSFVWDPIVNFLLGEGAAAMQFGSRFWILAIAAAVIHLLNRRKEKRAPKTDQPQEIPETTEE